MCTVLKTTLSAIRPVSAITWQTLSDFNHFGRLFPKFVGLNYTVIVHLTLLSFLHYLEISEL